MYRVRANVSNIAGAESAGLLTAEQAIEQFRRYAASGINAEIVDEDGNPVDPEDLEDR